MNKPKTQAELLQIIEEQEKQIRTLKQAMMRMEQNMANVSRMAQRTQGDNRRLAEKVHGLQGNVQRIQTLLS